MREAAFLRQNADRWKQFEELLAGGRSANPDQLADLFIQLTDDLAYARTNYPKSNTTQYLNGLARRVHQAIYRNRKERKGRFFLFWKQELPLLMLNVRRELLYSFLIFAVSVTVGVLSSSRDTSFARLILSDSYVNMTLENIEKGDPLGVYKRESEVGMFLYIVWNNVMVAFMMVGMGLFLSIGTVWLLFRNGVMVGAFQYFFIERGLWKVSALTIWIHGTLEMTAFVVAGAAGLVLGNSILFPKTYSRVESFMRGAKRSMKMVIGLVPIITAAGFLESFVTRHNDMPEVLSHAIIFGSLAFMIWYFLIYPIHVRNKLASDADRTH